MSCFWKKMFLPNVLKVDKCRHMVLLLVNDKNKEVILEQIKHDYSEFDIGIIGREIHIRAELPFD